MNWNFGGPNLDGIKKLVTTEGTTLEDVLSDNTLAQALRYETEEVIEFFSDIENVKGLLLYSLTTQYSDNPNYFRYARLATGVLSSACIELQNVLIDSNLLIPAFRNFFRLNPTETPLICGNYQRIVEHFIRVTHGEVLDQFPDLPFCLIENIEVLSFRLLLYNMLMDLREYIGDTQPIVDKLAEIIAEGGPTAFNATGLIREILKSEKNPLLGNLMENVVESLFQFILHQESTPLYKTEAFVVIELIVEKYKNQDFTKVIRSYEDKMDFESEGIDGAAIFRVYPNHLSQAFKRFFVDITNSFVGNICLTSIKTQENLFDFVKENEILNQIISKFTDEKCSGHLTQIAIYLSENEDLNNKLNDESESESDASKAWKEFVSTKLEEKKKLLTESATYGGERPTMIRQENAAKQAAQDAAILNTDFSIKNITTDNAFNFNSDSDEEESSDDSVEKALPTHHMIHKDPVQNLHYSSDEDKDSYGDYSNDEDENKQEQSQDQQFSDLMKQIWGFTTIETPKQEEVEDDEEEESNYSYEEEDEDD